MAFGDAFCSDGEQCNDDDYDDLTFRSGSEKRVSRFHVKPASPTLFPSTKKLHSSHDNFALMTRSVMSDARMLDGIIVFKNNLAMLSGCRWKSGRKSLSKSSRIKGREKSLFTRATPHVTSCSGSISKTHHNQDPLIPGATKAPHSPRKI